MKKALFAVLALLCAVPMFAQQLQSGPIGVPITFASAQFLTLTATASGAGGSAVFTQTSANGSNTTADTTATPISYTVSWGLSAVPTHGMVNVASYFSTGTALTGSGTGTIIPASAITTSTDGTNAGHSCTFSLSNEDPLLTTNNLCDRHGDAITAANLVSTKTHSITLALAATSALPPDSYAGVLNLLAYTY